MDPFTMISAGMQIFGALSSASSASKQAKQEAAAARQAAAANAAIAQQNAARSREAAGIAQQQGDAALEDAVMQATMVQGKLLANIGSSGISSNEGSALEVMSFSAGQSALDVARVKYKTDLTVRGYNQQADDFERDAAYMIQSGNAAYARGMSKADDIMTAGFINAGTAAFGLAAKYGWDSGGSSSSLGRGISFTTQSSDGIQQKYGGFNSGTGLRGGYSIF